MQNTSILIMTKAPLPGYVKTRLKGILTDTQCAELYTAFIKDTLDTALASKSKVYMAFTPNNAYDNLRVLVPAEVSLFPQKGAGLGERIYKAILDIQGQSPVKVIAIGCDTPLLNPTLLQEAEEALDKYDICIGPSEDGGYYLIALRQAYFALFENISWGTDKVLQGTLQAVKDLKLSCHLLPTLNDIDTPHDLIKIYDLLKATSGKKGFFPINTWDYLIKFKRYNKKL